MQLKVLNVQPALHEIVPVDPGRTEAHVALPRSWPSHCSDPSFTPLPQTEVTIWQYPCNPSFVLL
jgi:hypothetical protein